MARVLILTCRNGVGLEKSAELLREALTPLLPAGSLIDIHCFKRDPPPAANSYDLLIQLEVPCYPWFPAAPKRVFIPHPEWFKGQWRGRLEAFTQIWCLTEEGRASMLRQVQTAAQAQRLRLLWFRSRDLGCVPLDAPVNREFLHLCGSSPYKGTGAVINAWRGDPTLPMLTLVGRKDWSAAVRGIPNVRYLGCLSDADLFQRMRSTLFHVCTSEVEGWGHYIVEAMSLGIVPLVTAAPPMNELIDNRAAIFVSHFQAQACNAGTRYFCSPAAIRAAAHQALAEGPAEIAARRPQVREQFIGHISKFEANLRACLNELDFLPRPGV